jgi:flagellar biosynthetic protein FlhB
VVAKPFYDNSANLASLDPSVFMGLATEAIIAVLFAVTLVAGIVAVIDVSFQRFEYNRRQRMSLQEVREEMRSTDGDPQVKAQRRRLQRKRSQRRMLAEVPKATVVITNPTHFAVALRYERGQDDAPVCIAKGSDRVALKIREAAREAGVPVMENKLLARALYATAELDEAIPRLHIEAVAKIIGLIWSRQAPKRQS